MNVRQNLQQPKTPARFTANPMRFTPNLNGCPFGMLNRRHEAVRLYAAPRRELSTARPACTALLPGHCSVDWDRSPTRSGSFQECDIFTGCGALRSLPNAPSNSFLDLALTPTTGQAKTLSCDLEVRKNGRRVAPGLVEPAYVLRCTHTSHILQQGLGESLEALRTTLPIPSPLQTGLMASAAPRALAPTVMAQPGDYPVATAPAASLVRPP
jgi:hypothetical protein